MTARTRIIVLPLLLGLSGAAGLGLQLTWTRRFTLGLGHELPATLAVVTAFFLGLAAGAWMLDPRIRRTATPVRWCCGLEAAIGLWALATIPLIPPVNSLALQWIGIDPSPARHWLIAFGLPGLVLLPATAAMGATLPAAVRLATTWGGGDGRVSSLYAANTLGAVAGVWASVWWVMPAIGLMRSTLAFGLVNLVCAAGFAVAGAAGISKSKHAVAPGPDAVANRLGSAIHRLGLLVMLFVTGLAGIGFEIVGVRLLSQALENTVFSYAAALFVYLMGTAMGAAWWHRLSARRRPTSAWLLLGAGATCVVGAFNLGFAPDWFDRLRTAWGDAPIAVLAAEAAIATTVFLPATLAMGMVFSHLLEAAASSAGIGRAVAVNTLGGALAPLVFGVALFPSVGAKASLGLIVAAYVVLGMAARNWASSKEKSRKLQGASAEPRHRSPVAWWFAVGGVVALHLALVRPRLDLQRRPPGTRLVSLRQGTSDTVTVLENPDGNRVLRVNNRFSMGGTASANAERRHSHIPLLLHQSPRRALFLGVGTGISFAAMDTHPALEADGVELVPDVVVAMPEFAPHNRSGPRLRVTVADARRFVRATTNRYDVIVADLFHPARDGAGALYTLEHFRALRHLLERDGIACQWLPLFQLDEATLWTITRTWLEVFPESEAFLLRPNVDTPVLGLMGWQGRTGYGPGWMERRLTDPHLREQLRPLLLTDDLSLFGTWFIDRDALRRLSASAPLNTDDLPRVLFAAPRWNFRRSMASYALLEHLLSLPRGDPAGLILEKSRNVEPFIGRLRGFTSARDRYLAGLVADTEGRTEAAEAAFLDSAKTSADFTSGYSQILARATQQARSNPSEARRLLSLLIEVRPERPVARELLDRLGQP